MVKEKIEENGENSTKNWFKEFSTFIQDTSHVHTFRKDTKPKEFKKVVENLYKSIESTVVVKNVKTDPDVSVHFKCMQQENPEESLVGSCQNVKKRDVISFQAVLQLKNGNFCSPNNSKKVEIELQNANDKLVLDISCEECVCPEIKDESNSTKCSYQGNLICGGCNC